MHKHKGYKQIGSDPIQVYPNFSRSELGSLPSIRMSTDWVQVRSRWSVNIMFVNVQPCN